MVQKVRGYNARKELKEKDEAAVKIQAAFRGHQVRKKSKKGGHGARNVSKSRQTKQGIDSGSKASRSDSSSPSPSPKGASRASRDLSKSTPLPSIARSTNNAAGNARNQALLFLKPHANNKRALSRAKKLITKFGISITGEGTLDGDKIEDGKMVSKQWPLLEQYAMSMAPAELPVDPAQFTAAFPEESTTWSALLAADLVLDASSALQRLTMDATELLSAWTEAQENGAVHSFGKDLQIGQITVASSSSSKKGKKKGKKKKSSKHQIAPSTFYIVNGFVPQMVQSYHVGDGISYFVLEWNASLFSWPRFLANVVGDADPEKAKSASIRGNLFADWRKLGLDEQPGPLANGVHASSSPKAATAELKAWLGMK